MAQLDVSMTNDGNIFLTSISTLENIIIPDRIRYGNCSYV